MGLDVPDSMELVSKLNAAGMNIEGACLTIDEAADKIAKIIKEK